MLLSITVLCNTLDSGFLLKNPSTNGNAATTTKKTSYENGTFFVGSFSQGISAPQNRAHETRLREPCCTATQEVATGELVPDRIPVSQKQTVLWQTRAAASWGKKR